MQENIEKVFSDQQEKLRKWVEIPQDGRGYFPKPGDKILALDIQYVGDFAHIGGDLWEWQGGHIDTFAAAVKSSFPYVPGYFCFREGPPLLSFYEKLRDQYQIFPDLIIIDGHGTAHPRKLGVACWMGIATKVPTIGCAKDTLVHYEGALEEKKAARLPVFVDKDLVGYVLRTQDGIKPLFVSPGHLVSLETSALVILGLPGEYRIPDILRNADQAARHHAKSSEYPYQDLQTIPEVMPFWENP
ncbi:MAG: endonuclease V [Candidatus Brocadiae bacterium]|nr:endonuclease V [Candidatus Brocadiia bacterium]